MPVPGTPVPAFLSVRRPPLQGESAQNGFATGRTNASLFSRELKACAHAVQDLGRPMRGQYP